MGATLAIRFRAVTVILCAALVLGAAGPAVAQVPDPELVSWSYGFFQVPTPTLDEIHRAERDLSPLRYRMYGARERIELGLNVMSSTSTPLWISQARLRATLSFRMFTDGAEIPTVIVWEPTVRIVTDSSDTVSEASDLVSDLPLPPNGNMTFWLAVERADGRPFAPAEYTVTGRMPGLRSAITTPDGAPWPGRAPDLNGSGVPLGIIDPTTPGEISLMHYLAGWDLHFRRQSLDDAAARLGLAVQADPSHARAQRLLGATYMMLGLYPLASMTYEALVTLPNERQTENLRALAMSYVAVRDEARATRILQEARLPIAPTLAQMRRNVEILRVPR